MSPAGVLAWHTPHCLWTVLDVVESAVRTGRTAEASAHVDAMRAADVAAISPRLALVVAGAAAIAADGDEATQLYEASLAVAGVDRWPFDLARITLCFGEHLRRQHDLVESRVHLRAAADIFERLRAVPWALRAENELRAAGVSRTAYKRRVVTALTPEELRIADLAATGLSNKQIAERVHLSHRTVGARLHKVFPKLRITTRAGLRDALDALEAATST
jgi:DNA-binding CsgD family transcriptional regulator